MKKQQTPHGALRARTRAFFCALTLALLCITTPAKAQIWGRSTNTIGVDFSTGVANSAVTVTATPDPDDPTNKQRVVIFKEGTEFNSQIPKIWVTLIVDAAVTINSFEDIPVGTYFVSDSKAVGTALASQGLTADTRTGSVIGTGAQVYYTSSGNVYWFHAVESANNYVTVGDDYSEDHHKLMSVWCEDFRHETGYTVNMNVCYSGTTGDYKYCQSDPVICGSGTAVYSYTRATSRKLGRRGSYITATPDEGYTFHHWEDGDGNNLGTENPYIFYGWGPESIKAVFSDCGELAPVTPTYTVAATVSPTEAGTVTGDGTFEEGEDVTLTADPANRRYVFSHWTDEGNSAGTDGVATYTINDIAADHNKVVAVFTEVPVTLDDNGTSDYYTATASTFTGEMDFQLMRTFYAGMWNTVCFPFDLTASQIEASDMRTATFYTLSSVTGDAAEGLDFNVSEVTALSARTPYLVQVSGANIVNPVFKDVTLTASAFTNNTTGTNVGNTRFFGTVHPTDLEIGENSGFLFLGQNNALYWPNVANKIRAFRAYFYSGDNTVQAVHPRVRLVVRPETPTDVIEGYNADTRSAVGLPVPARKVLDNGNLIIERDGIRYNAVGQRVN
ncbi:MAG: hypothetical protein IJ621_06810 [Paludibacteraceae bacterium]|nr:hypothetical protein [Paludibacteraceae bacterium]